LSDSTSLGKKLEYVIAQHASYTPCSRAIKKNLKKIKTLHKKWWHKNFDAIIVEI
jgi:hypothetical protein